MNKTYDKEGTIDITFGISNSFFGESRFIDIESRSANSLELSNQDLIYVLKMAVLKLEKSQNIRNETT